MSMNSARAQSHIVLRGRGGEEEEGKRGKREGQGCGQDADVDRRDDGAESPRKRGRDRGEDEKGKQEK